MKLEDWSADAIAVDFVDKAGWSQSQPSLPAVVSALAAATGFDGKPGTVLIAPALDGGAARVYFGVEEKGAKKRDPFLAGKLATALPPGLYRLGEGVADPQQRRAGLSAVELFLHALCGAQGRKDPRFARRRASTARA